ncbi:MAG: NAD-dependent epimerase/dehydratase family protein [Smithella sp.]
MHNPLLVLITGATGAVGPLVVTAFSNAGYLVRTFSLDRPRDRWPQNVETVSGDVTDKEAVRKAMIGVDVVIHLAALLHIVNPPPELQKKYEQINVGGTKNIVEAAVKAGVDRIVFFSTIAVYGMSDGNILNEDSPTNPATFYAKTKLAAEKMVLLAKNKEGLNIGTILRLGAVYGSRIKGNYERLMHALARHRFIPIGKGLNRRSLVYDKDVAQAAVLAAFHPVAAGRVYNVTDGEFHTVNEIINSICFALGRKRPRVSLPIKPACIIAHIIEKVRQTTGLKLPAVKAMIDKYSEDVIVDGGLIQKELGFSPRYDLQRGWVETISEMRLG